MMKTVCIIVFIFVVFVGCSSESPQETEIDIHSFEGKQVSEVLSYMYTKYSYYDKANVYFDFDFHKLKGYEFYYYDSTEVREIVIEIDAKQMEYLPRKLGKEYMDIPLEFVFPLYLFKKERIHKIKHSIYPLSKWIAREREDDSVAAVIAREVIVEEVLDSLARIKRR